MYIPSPLLINPVPEEEQRDKKDEDDFTHEHQHMQEQEDKDEDGFIRERQYTQEELAVEELQAACEREDNQKPLLANEGKSGPRSTFETLMTAGLNNWKESERDQRTGGSERQERYRRAKARDLAKEAQLMPQITKFFKPTTSLSILDD